MEILCQPCLANAATIFRPWKIRIIWSPETSIPNMVKTALSCMPMKKLAPWRQRDSAGVWHLALAMEYIVPTS